MSFHDWIFWHTVEADLSYKPMHLITTAVVFLVMALFIYLAITKRISNKNKDRIIKGVAIFQLAFEVIWRIIYLVRGNTVIQLWPFYPCNLAGIIIPIAVLCNNKILKKMFYVFGFVGGIITFALPQGIFVHHFFSFPILKSVLQHTGILIIPAFEVARGTFKIKLKDFGWMFLGLCVHVVNSEGIGWLAKYPVAPGDYMYYRSGLPFVIPGIPQFITLSVFGILILALIYVLCDIKTVINFVKNKKLKSTNSAVENVENVENLENKNSEVENAEKIESEKVDAEASKTDLNGTLNSETVENKKDENNKE